MSPRGRWAPAVLALVGFLAVTSVIKVALNARDELAQGHAALVAGRLPGAVEHFERAVRWYLPGLQTFDEAAAALWAIAETYEEHGYRQPALDTFRGLRGSIYATRSVFTPGRDWIGQCNRKIAALMAQGPPYSEAERGQTFEQRRQAYLILLEKERPPHTGWALAAEAGFFGWVGCLVGLIMQGFTRRGELRPRPALGWGTGFVLLYILWLAGLAGV